MENEKNNEITENVEENTENVLEQGKGKPDKITLKKRVIKIGLAALIIICSICLLSSAVWAVASNYIFFPKLDDALENSLEPKLDIGTSFDISDLLKEGRIELELSDIEEYDMDKLMLSLAYNKNEAAFNATLDEEQFAAVATKKGFAASSNKINDGENYGFSFKDLEERYKDSSFAYRGDSKYALDKYTHKQLLEYIETFEDMTDGSSSSKKDVENIKKAIARAFKKSEISDCEYSYAGIKVGDSTRSARCKTYSFGKEELVEFVENLIDEFDDPSASLEKSLERLRIIDDGENRVVEALDSIIYSLDAADDHWKVTVAFAYVNRAVSAIVGKVTYVGGEAKFTIDFGEDPQRDTNMDIVVEIDEYVGSDEASMTVNKSKLYASYASKREGDRGTASLSAGVDIHNSDIGNFKYELTAKGVFDDKNEKAELSLTFGDGEQSLFDAMVECKLEDKASKLSLELEKITVKSDGKDTDIELPCDIKLSIYRSAGPIKLPRFEDVLDMEGDEFDKLCDKANDYLDGLSEKYGLGDLGLGIFSDKDPDPEEDYTEGEKENEELNNIGGTVYADAFPETTDLELDGYYVKKTNDRIGGWYSFIAGTTFLNDEGKGTKSGKYRIDLEQNRIYFEVQEYPEPYYLVKTFEQIDDNTIKIGYDTYEKKNK